MSRPRVRRIPEPTPLGWGAFAIVLGILGVGSVVAAVLRAGGAL